MRFQLHQGDCLQTLRAMPDNSVDSIVTDPPYGLSFMGRKWDYDVPSVEIWAECLRVLKPGGHLLAFAGTRTQHRMAVRIEDAGFEIRDMIAWVYGSGFPKSLDVSKAIDKAAGAEREVVGPKLFADGSRTRSGAGKGEKFNVAGNSGMETIPATDAARQWQGWGTALKPSLEPVTVARKPLIGTVAENVLAHGTGALNIDGCRVEGGERPLIERAHQYRPDNFDLPSGSVSSGSTTTGRWPANLIHDGSEEVLAGFPSSAARFFKECKQEWQDQGQSQSNVETAELSLSLQSALESIVQSAAATWQSLAGIVSSDVKGHSTSVTASELESIAGACTAAMAVIASGCLPESRLEKRSLCGSLVSVAATRSQTGITTITASLLRSGGYADHATSSITPTNLDRGEAVSRFNYCAKASKSDRDEGLEGFEVKEVPKMDGGDFVNPMIGSDSKKTLRANIHPTVKPTDLMRYLCRLVTPPGGTVLDPFTGSGSTGKAAILEGFQFIGCELSEEYIAIARARIEAACAQDDKQQDLFA